MSLTAIFLCFCLASFFIPVFGIVALIIALPIALVWKLFTWDHSSIKNLSDNEFDAMVYQMLNENQRLKAIRNVKVRKKLDDIRAKEYLNDYYVKYETFDKLEESDFIEYCMKLLKRNGFTNVRLAFYDSCKRVIQCEKYGKSYTVYCRNKNNYTADPMFKKIYGVELKSEQNESCIKKAIGAFKKFDSDYNVVLSNINFNENAVKFAKEKDVVLWNRARFLDLVKQVDFIKTTEKVTEKTTEKVSEPKVVYKEEIKVEVKKVDKQSYLAKKSIEEKKTINQDKQADITGEAVIDIDKDCADYCGIEINNVSMKYNNFSESVEILFDVASKEEDFHLKSDVIITCILYSGDKKLERNEEYVLSEYFFKKDSCILYFPIKNISEKITRIEFLSKKIG